MFKSHCYKTIDLRLPKIRNNTYLRELKHVQEYYIGTNPTNFGNAFINVSHYFMALFLLLVIRSIPGTRFGSRLFCDHLQVANSFIGRKFSACHNTNHYLVNLNKKVQ